jgi:hypothetical protein
MTNTDRHGSDEALDLALARRGKASLGQAMWPLEAAGGRSGAWFLCLWGAVVQSS